YIYDHDRHDLTLRSTPILSLFARRFEYLGALELVDLTLGEIRRSMEKQGTWDETTVLLTSDHQLRSFRPDGKTSGPRVPYLLKLAGQHVPVSYEAGFRTVLTSD